MHYLVESGSVVGLGGLGHMAVKFGAALGAHVTIISTSESKRNDAMKLGGKGFLLSTDKEQMAQAKSSFDFIIDTVSANHNVNAILNLLAFEGVYCLYVSLNYAASSHHFMIELTFCSESASRRNQWRSPPVR